KAVERVAELPQERVAETDRLTGLLADGLDLDHLLTDRLTGGTPAIRRVPNRESSTAAQHYQVAHNPNACRGRDSTAAPTAGDQSRQQAENDRDHEDADEDYPAIDETPQEPCAPRGQLTRRVVPRRVSPTSGGTVLRNRLTRLLRHGLAGLLRRRRAWLLGKPARRLAEGLRPGRRTVGVRHECS